MRLLSFIDDLQARGRYTFTLEELRVNELGSRADRPQLLRRLWRNRSVTSPKRGFYVIVPSEYRSAGSPPASWFVDDLMRYLGQPYYVGLLSAAAIHGAAHQQPIRFQIVTNQVTRSVINGRVRIDFHVNQAIEALSVDSVQTETGYMRVATVEITAFDLVKYVRHAGGLSNVATVLIELVELIDASKLEIYCDLYPTTTTQRLGHLLDEISATRHANVLYQQLQKRRYRATPLTPGKSTTKQMTVSRFGVIVNDEIEPDL